MERETVYGSGILSMGYDRTTQILEIEWPRSRVYQYNVPEHVYWNLRDSDEKTAHFNQYIRRRYPGHRIS